MSPIQTPQTLAGAFQGLLDTLALINGAPDFNHDLEGRVYSVIASPSAGQKMPYVCTAFSLFDGRTTEAEQNAGKDIFRPWIHGFVPERASGVMGSSTPPDALKLVDDLKAVIRQNSTLGGKVKYCIPLQFDGSAGVKLKNTAGAAVEHGECWLRVEIAIWSGV